MTILGQAQVSTSVNDKKTAVLPYSDIFNVFHQKVMSHDMYDLCYA